MLDLLAGNRPRLSPPPVELVVRESTAALAEDHGKTSP